MNWKTANLSRLIALSFSFILMITLIIGFIVHFETKLLWSYTRDLYFHPFQENRAVNNLKSIINSIDNSLENFQIYDSLSVPDQVKTIVDIDFKEKEALQLFDVAYKTYTGPVEKIDSAFLLFKNWKPMRDELITLKRSGSDTRRYFQLQRENKIYLDKILSPIDAMVKFNRDRADEYYKRAREGMTVFEYHLWTLFTLLVLSAIIIVYYLIRSIRVPLKELTRIANQYSNGNYSVRSDYNSPNEIGILASAFNNLASAVQEELMIKNVVSGMALILLNENDLDRFCKTMLSNLISETKSDSGAIYFLDKKKAHYELYQVSGLPESWNGSFAIQNPLPARVAAETEAIHFTYATEKGSFPELSGDFNGKEIIMIPLLENHAVNAFVMLSSSKKYSSMAVKLTKEIMPRLDANLNRVLSFNKMLDFSSELDRQYHILEKQSLELEQRSEELIRKNRELEIAKERAESADRLKTSFILNMSHELRTPLNSIIGFSGILMQQLPGPLNKEQQKQIKMVQESGCHLLSLINDILDISKIEAGELKPSYEEFDIQQIIENVIKMIWPFASGKHLPVNFARSNDIGLIMSDKQRVHQVLLNIVNNAVKFTEKGGVEIKCSRNNDKVSVEVADSGIGIKKEDIENLFNPFVQLENSLTRKFEGSGLGLSISKKLIDMLSGSIKVESQYGKGSIFTVTLPVQPPKQT